jgi:hypothetical protein
VVSRDLLSSQQLLALGQVAGALEREGIDHWLFGGWAVDFYAGAVTRAHDDVDLAVWLADLPQIRRLLEADGWRHAPQPDEDGGTGFERGGVRLELTFLVRHGDVVVTPVGDGGAAWPEGAFGDDRGELGGVHARLVALEALRRGKSSPREDADEAAKDRADAAVLAQPIGTDGSRPRSDGDA